MAVRALLDLTVHRDCSRAYSLLVLEQPMRERSFSAWLMLVALLLLPALALSQAVRQSWTLIINGRPGQAAVVHMDGKSYVELESLARLVNGSLAFSGNQITLTLPGSVANAPAAASSTSQSGNPAFSKDFMRAGIEEMSTIREWRSAILNVVQNSYPFTESWLNGFRDQSAKSLRLASVAVSNDSDRSAFQLLSNVFDNMQQLSNKLLKKRQSLEYIPPNFLNDDPLNQKVLACARSLASMAASGQFEDDGSCH